jgi:predicted RNA-binding Zn-ribbon protein involved in translation (DUF1610 family)
MLRRNLRIAVRNRNSWMASLDQRMTRAVKLVYRCRGCGFERSEFLESRPDLNVGDVGLSPRQTIPCPGCGKVEAVVVRVVGESLPPPGR